MTLSWWRKALNPSTKTTTLGTRRHRARLVLELLEDRLVPAATYQWTGFHSAVDVDWDDPDNWSGPAGQQPGYPGSGLGGVGDVAQFVDPFPGTYPTVNGAFSIAEIDFGSASNVTIASDGVAGHGLTISGKIVSADNFGAPNAGTDEISAPITAAGGLQVINSAASTSALVQLAGAVNMGANALTLAGNVTLSGILSTTAGLTVNGPGTVTLSGNNTAFSGPTMINSGGALTVESGTALGSTPGNVTINGTLNVESVPGIGAMWYNWQPATAVGTATESGGNVTGVTLTNGGVGYTIAPTVVFTNATGDTTGAGAAGIAILGIGAQAGRVVGITITNPGNGLYTAPPTVSFNSTSTGSTDTGVHGPRSVLGDPVTPGTPAAILAYAAALQAAGDVISDGIPGETTATPNGTNVNGTYLEYGGNSSRATVGGTGNGFPTAVQQNPPAIHNGASIMGIFQGLFYAPVAGVYDFSTGSDDGSVVFVDGKLVTDNNQGQGYTVRDSNNPFTAASATTAPTLTAGLHTVLMEYFNGGGGYNFDAFVQGPTGSGYTSNTPVLNSEFTPFGSPGLFNFQLASLQGTGTLNVPAPVTGQVTLLAGSTFGGNITGQGTITVQSGAMTLTTDEGFRGTWVLNGNSSLTLGTTGTPISGENISTIVNNTSNSVVINNPSGNTFTLKASISGPTSGLTLNGTGTYTLGGASTFTGAVAVPAGVTINITGTSPLGAGDVTLPASSTLNVSGYTLGTGLAVTWYGWGGNTTPLTGAGGNPPALTIGPAPYTAANTPILAYAAKEGVIPDGIPFETTATPNVTNVNGTYLEYGGNSSRGTIGGTGNGFPNAVQNNNVNGSSIMGIFSGLFFAAITGVYNFSTGSDDGSNVWIDGKLVVDNNNVQGYTVRSSSGPFDAGATTAPTLTAGVHSILIDYYNGGGGYSFDAFVNGALLTNAELGVPVINFSVGSLAGAGTVNLGADGLVAGADGTSTTFTGTINGTATSNGVPNFTKAGTGTMVIPNLAQLNITGSLAITGGTLMIGNGTNALSSLPASSILDNGTLVLNGPSGSTFTYNGNITGSGGVTYQGAGILNLGGNSSYTGPTVIPSTAGTTVNATSSTALGNGNFNLPTGTTLNVTTTGTPDLGSGLPGEFFSLAGATNTGTATANDTLPDGRFSTVSGVNAIIAQYGTTGGVEGGTVVPIATDTSAFTTTNPQLPTNTNGDGAFFDFGTATASGFPNVVKQINGNFNSVMGVWTGIFFAPVAGTYNFDTVSDDGSTLFIDGNIVVNNNFGQGSTTRFGSVNMTAGAHQIEIAWFNGGGGYALWADVELPGTTAFQRLPSSLLGTVAPSLLQIGALSGGGTVNLGVSGGINNGLNVGGDNASTTFTGTINAPGTNIANFPILFKAGTGTFVLPGGETYTGTTSITGSLVLGSASAPVTALPTTGITDNGNLTLFLPNNSTQSYNHSITGSGGLTINGTGATLTLGAVNTYSGPTLVGGNKLVQGVANALPPGSAIEVGTSATSSTPNLSGQVDLNGFNGGIGNITAVGNGTGNVLTNSSSTAVMLTLTGTGSIININVPITGKISLIVNGTGTVLLSPPPSTPNSYAGSTTITGPTVIVANLPSGFAVTVSGTGVLDVDGGNWGALIVSGNGVLNVSGGLNVLSLSGFGTTNTINDISTTPVTFTIDGPAAGSFSYTGAITGPVSIINATGPQTLTVLTGGPGDTFSGSVTATSGTLGGLPGSFGTGPVTLNGGTADLAGSQEVAGFGGNGVGWTVNTIAADVNGAGTFTSAGTSLPAANTFELTSANGNEATDLIFNTPEQPNGGFTASFTYLDNSPSSGNPADGITFFLEADAQGPAALGGSGGSLGYGPGGTGSNSNGSIRNSVAIALNLYSGAAGGRGTALQTNGAIAAAINPSGGFNILTSGHPINVVLTYDGATQVLMETVTDTVTGATGVADFSGVNLFSLLGSANAFIGFSGSTGTSNAQQLISNFQYVGASGAVTAFTNNFLATSGTTSSLTVQANSLANAFSTSGNLVVPTGPAAITLNIAADPTSTANQPYSLTIGGSTTLGGNVNLVNNGTGTGTLMLAGPVSGAGVGTSFGAIGGGGNVVLASTSTYNVVLGGPTQPAGWNNLSVSGALNLAGGNVNVFYANNFSPSLGESFTILQSTGPLTGQFAQGSTIMVGNITYAITYTANSVILTAFFPVRPPTHLTVSAPSTATAGTPITVTIAAVDSSNNVDGSDNDTVTLSTSASGGSIAPTTVTLSNGSATIPVTLTKTGTQTITATDVTTPSLTAGMASVAVSPGAFSQYAVTTVTSIPGQTTAGNAFLIEVQATDSSGNAVSSYSGPSSATVSISPTASGFPVVVPLSALGTGATLGTIDAVGSYTISATGGSVTGSGASLTVVPAAAAKLGFLAQPTNTATGDKLGTVTVAIQDQFGNTVTSGPDSTDSVTISVATFAPAPGVTGTGAFLSGSTLTGSAVGGVASFNNLTLVNPGNYSLGALVPGKFIGPNSSTFNVAPLQVVPGSFTSSPSGFALQFNAPLLVNSTTPVLYGSGFGATAPVPSVTLTGPSGPVEGSVVVNTATNSLTFVETNTASLGTHGTPILPDGTYTLDVRGSGATGLQALNSGGGFLDGLGNGTPGSGDYTTTFTISAGAAGDDVVWVAATADGPGQPLEAPGNNKVGGGYPIYLDDSTGMANSVTVTLNYNPALLTVTGVTGTDFSLLASSTPGHANLQYSGPMLPKGTQTPIGFITATVPGGTTGNPTPYKAKDLLHLSNVSVANVVAEPPISIFIPATTSDALDLVAYVGDADGNGSYSSNDAVLITRVSLDADTGFAAYPLVDPVIVADTDGAGFIPADAPLQASEAGVGFPTANLPNPPVPTGVHFQAIANNVDPSVSIPSGLHVGADGTMTVPVNIDDARPEGSTGLIRANLALTYNPSLFIVSAADVHLGSVLAGGNWSVVPTIDQATRQIAIALSSTTPISSSIAGSLVTIDFHLSEGVRGQESGVRDDGSALTPDPSPLTPFLLVASVSPNGQQVATELEDAQGTFTLTPAPTNGYDPRIDGVVTLMAPSPVVSFRTSAANSEAISVAPPIEVQGTESRPSEIAVTETTVAVAPAPEATAMDNVPETATEHPSSTLAHAAVFVAVANSGSASILMAVPLGGQAFQVGNTLVVTGPSWADAAWQPVLLRQLTFLPYGPDDLILMSWNELVGELYPPDPVSSAGIRPRAGRETTVYPTPDQLMADQAALDHYFAQAGDDSNQIAENE